MGIIKTKNLNYRVKIKNENNEVTGYKTILDDININVKNGEFIAILGQNGSGKSTFAKHLNALLLPNEGSVFINGEDTSLVDELWKIRKQCGMVFQNPDNQIVGVTVEEDVGFGPENIGMPSKKIVKTVNHALEKVGMSAFKKKSPNHLSGGQKQRVAIASSLAMKPECIVLDEPTAMLDPKGRKDVLDLVKQLNKEEKMTIILITHHMEEAVSADKIFILNDGKPVICGTPRDVFLKIDEIRSFKLELPQIMELSYRLYQKGKISRYDMLDVDEFVAQYKEYVIKNNMGDIKKIRQSKNDNIKPEGLIEKTIQLQSEAERRVETDVLQLKNVSYSYDIGTSMENKAVIGADLSIKEKEFIGIIGHTGSGKSTLIQLMNGLIKPSEGEIYFRGKNIAEKDFNKRQLHFSVGLVFQYPESQLFEETVLSDVMYGPLNKGYEKEQAEEIAKKSLKSLGIDEEYFDKSPFDLSGGQKRRVAIAGVIAMEPDIIILDEPTAGLDPLTKDRLLESLKSLRQNKGKTIIIVSHSMEDVANYVERVIVINEGRIVFDDATKQVFKNIDELEKMGLAVPTVTYVMRKLKNEGYTEYGDVITIEEAVNVL